jgi:hypothetical protein
MIDNYRKGWALRYLREAKAELTAAQDTPPMAPSLVLEAMKKAQVAIYYSLGDPAFVEAIVLQTLQREQTIEDPALRCLVEIERTVQRFAQAPEQDRQKALEQADEFIQMASDIVKLFIGEKITDELN